MKTYKIQFGEPEGIASYSDEGWLRELTIKGEGCSLVKDMVPGEECNLPDSNLDYELIKGNETNTTNQFKYQPMWNATELEQYTERIKDMFLRILSESNSFNPQKSLSATELEQMEPGKLIKPIGNEVNIATFKVIEDYNKRQQVIEVDYNGKTLYKKVNGLFATMPPSVLDKAINTMYEAMVLMTRSANDIGASQSQKLCCEPI